MALIVKTVLKPLNADQLMAELAALPIAGVTWAGFDKVDDRRYGPMAAAREIGHSVSNGVRVSDTANPGELRITTSRDLTAPETTSLDSILAAHNAATLSAEQQRQDQDTTDLSQLLSDFSAWDGMNNAQRNAALKRVLRLMLRKHARAGV